MSIINIIYFCEKFLFVKNYKACGLLLTSLVFLNIMIVKLSIVKLSDREEKHNVKIG